MPNKNSAKKASKAVAAESSVVEKKKNTSTPKKAVNEIDEIFAGKKRKKPEIGNAEKGVDKVKKKKNKHGDKDKSKGPKWEGFGDAPTMPRKKTADGLKVYSEEELGIGNSNAGGTRLCPFDCDCCF